jgi:cell division protein FtsB
MTRKALGAPVSLEEKRREKCGEEKDQRRPTRKKYRINWLRLLVVVAVCYALVMLCFQQLQVQELQTEATRLSQQLEQAEARNAELEAELVQLQDDKNYMEFIARKELGMVKGGEIQYIFETR